MGIHPFRADFQAGRDLGDRHQLPGVVPSAERSATWTKLEATPRAIVIDQAWMSARKLAACARDLVAHHLSTARQCWT